MEQLSAQLQELNLRLSKMERENRWLKQGCSVVLIGILAAMLMGQSNPSRTVEAERFIVKDASGNMRAELGMYQGQPTLSFAGTDGKVRLAMNPDLLELKDEHGHPRAQLKVFSDSPGLFFFDTEGITRAGMTQNTIVLGKATTSEGLPSRVQIGEGLVLTDKNGHKTITLSSEGPSLDFTDEEGFRTLIGSTNLSMERGGTRRTSAAFITLIGKDDKPLWSAP